MAVSTRTLKIEGMNCDHCVVRIQNALAGVEGVQTADVDLSAGSAKVAFDEDRVTFEDLVRAVDNAGYSVVND